MAVAVNKTLLFTTLSNIKFSDLRSNFKEETTGLIKASELIRNTDVNDADPIVPDAKENENISESRTNWKASTFQNSIKTYDLEQTGTDLNLNLFSQTWNSNLTKNIKKTVSLTGTCGSNDINSPACTFNESAYNLTIKVTGSILGAGGAGGTSCAGGNGGRAMSLTSSTGRIKLITFSGARIYGGGGGGGKGNTGATGATGTCVSYSDYTTGENCGSCPGCGGDRQIDCYGTGGCNCGKGGCRSTKYRSVCRRANYYTVPGAPGGAGGNGGLGQGYNQTRSNGTAGSAGTVGGCPSYGGSGNAGETGGDGGDWGAPGKSSSVCSAGLPGTSLTGSNVIIDPSSDLTVFKGRRTI